MGIWREVQERYSSLWNMEMKFLEHRVSQELTDRGCSYKWETSMRFVPTIGLVQTPDVLITYQPPEIGKIAKFDAYFYFRREWNRAETSALERFSTSLDKMISENILERLNLRELRSFIKLLDNVTLRLSELASGQEDFTKAVETQQYMNHALYMRRKASWTARGMIREEWKVIPREEQKQEVKQ